MTGLTLKWNDLWKAFESTRKSEWLKSTEAGKFAAMMKEAKPMKEMLEALDAAEPDILNACAGSHGKTREEAPLLLKSFVSKMTVLKKGTLRILAKASLAEMDKVTKPNTYRALKILITGIDEIESLAAYLEKTMISSVIDAGKTMTKEDNINKVQRLALAQVKKGAMKSLACLQKVKASPTPATWTTEMNAAMTRDLIMGLVSLVGAQAKGLFDGVPTAKPHKALADAWNTGQPLSAVGPADNETTIKKKVSDWGKIVKDIVTAYQAHW